MVRNNCKKQKYIKGYGIITLKRVNGEGIFDMIKNVFSKSVPISKNIIKNIPDEIKTTAKKLYNEYTQKGIQSTGEKIGDVISKN